MEVTLVSPVYAELDDLDNYFTADESLTDDEDEYLINAKINFEPVEELYSSFIPLDHFKPTDEWHRRFFSKKKPNPNPENLSEIVSEREHRRNTEKATKVTYSFFSDDISEELTEFDSNYLSKHEIRRDDMHISKLQDHISDNISDLTDEIVNDITCHFMERQHIINKSGEKNNEQYDLKFETSNFKEIGSFSKCTGHVGNKQNIPKKKRRLKIRMTRGSLADIIKWQTSLQRNNTVLYDISPGIAEGKPALHQIAQGDVNDNREDSRRGDDTNSAEFYPENLSEVKSCTQQGCSNASGTQKPVTSRHEDCSQNTEAGSCNCCEKKAFQIAQAADVSSTTRTNIRACKNQGSFSLQPDNRSVCLSLSTTNTLSSFFDRASLFNVGNDENLNLEWIRLTTFSDWPLTSIFSTILARNGWVSLGEGDRARCYSCHVVHEGWRIGDNPDQYHNLNCRFKTDLSNNIPISRATPSKVPFQEEPQQRLESTKQCSFLSKEAGELTTAATKDIHQQRQQVATTTTSAEISTCTKEAMNREPSGINVDRPRFPSYAILAVRISSYTNWPAAMTQTPRDLALAGFFYVGNDDYTRCFCCGGGLSNWEASDDPWFEHARWFNECAFVRQNRGQEFIDLVQKRLAESINLPSGFTEKSGRKETNTIAKQNSTPILKQSDSVVENAAHQMRQSDPAREIYLHTLNEDTSDKYKMESYAELNALKEENMNLRNQLTCKICLEEKVAIGLSPCGHLACCETCAPTVIECPVCQEFVTNFFKAMLVRQKNRRC